MLQNVTTLLYLSGEPLTVSSIAKLVNASQEDVLAILPQIDASLAPLGLQLLVNGDEVAITTQTSQAALVEAFWKEDLSGELTPAALQVLTLVAYLGSATRADISCIRGVQSSQSIRTLSVRGLIEREGEVCKLTTDALQYLGVTSPSELPDYENLHKELVDKLTHGEEDNGRRS
jgi:segregation and condensation protein B